MPVAEQSLHAVHRLFDYRQSISTKPYASRGNKVCRCRRCLLPAAVCTCAWRRPCVSNAAFALVMYDSEVLKPSNSGRLIADLIPDTHAFLWSRTEPSAELLALLADSRYQAYLVFPGEYALEQRVVEDFSSELPQLAASGKTPLFILLDGCWREAVKMFRKSPYLQQLPMLSFRSEALANYRLRKGKRDFQMGTAEVASLVLEAWGEADNAAALDSWFNLFVECTLWSRTQNKSASLQRIAELQQQVLQR
ncbi:DTW domain-containing protein [Shewanella avicenniae]|uniref:tRNA-uridine aminocarboxypropyltransferase n=1 Tax=Shewanella avicenniae TaxID=2814294 RepID=A0ABX7QMA6_9GAMM|nr:DTW domain-containing protein [Shewanella avicenniae]QSX32010.1 DTW domain-containing protein [Shewanella avicenniae]